MPTNTATRSRRSGQRGGGRRQAAVPADVRAEIERTTASIGAAMTQLVQALPDAAAEDHTTTAKTEQPNRAARRERDRAQRAEEAEQRGLLAEIEGRNRKQLILHYVTAGLLGPSRPGTPEADLSRKVGACRWSGAGWFYGYRSCAVSGRPAG